MSSILKYILLNFKLLTIKNNKTKMIAIIIITILIIALVIEAIFSPRIDFYNTLSESIYDNPFKEHCIMYYNDVKRKQPKLKNYRCRKSIILW